MGGIKSAETPKTRRLTVLGKELEVKNYICSADGVNYPPKPGQVRLQLSICLTGLCPAACPFCIAAKDRNKKEWVDLKKLEKMLIAVRDEGIIRGVSFTGGEPFLDVKLLDEAIHLVFEVLGYHTEVSVTTNGMNLKRMHEIRDLSYLDALHISRHHYSDEMNDSVFGRKMPSARELAEIVASVSYPDLFVMNCILMKDYIGTDQEVHRFLDHAIEIGVPKVSFITAAPVNAFAKEQAVEYEQVLRKDDPALLFTRGFQDHEICRCQDGVYVSGEGKLIRFYGRATKAGGCGYCRGFVFGPDNRLRAGFDGEVIR